MRLLFESFDAPQKLAFQEESTPYFSAVAVLGAEFLGCLASPVEVSNYPS